MKRQLFLENVPYKITKECMDYISFSIMFPSHVYTVKLYNKGKLDYVLIVLMKLRVGKGVTLNI